MSRRDIAIRQRIKLFSEHVRAESIARIRVSRLGRSHPPQTPSDVRQGKLCDFAGSIVSTPSGMLVL